MYVLYFFFFFLFFFFSEGRGLMVRGEGGIVVDYADSATGTDVQGY